MPQSPNKPAPEKIDPGESGTIPASQIYKERRHARSPIAR
jgi:hypothetical protein